MLICPSLNLVLLLPFFRFNDVKRIYVSKLANNVLCVTVIVFYLSIIIVSIIIVSIIITIL